MRRCSLIEFHTVEDFMKKSASGFLQLCFILLLSVAGNRAFAQAPPPQAQPANVAGNWTIYSKGPTGETATQTIELQQNGGNLTGHFKGPHQSGGLQGTIDQQHIVFRTKTRFVLTFRGRVTGDRVQGTVQGNAMSGTFHVRAGTGQWQASRSN
jgi:hypothetical protein